MKNLSIINTAIRTDAEGRYCLNDCHKASGAEKKDGPSYWLATKDAEKIVAKLNEETTGMSVVTIEGRLGGTFVAKELVYSYAMWISPAFHLQVIRAFDAMVTESIKSPSPKPRKPRKPAIGSTFSQFMRIASYLPLDENQRILAAARGTYNLTGTNPLEQMGVTSIEAPVNDQHYTPTQLGELCGLSGMKMNARLASAGLQNRVGNTWKMTEQARPYARIFDTTRKNGKGSQEQLKWLKAVLDIL